MNNKIKYAEKAIKVNVPTKTKDIVLIAFFAALIAICSQIQIPAAIPFTLQTLAIFITSGLLGWKNGTISILVYIMLGLIGLPVFAGFSAGIGALFGLTGGYIIGFIFTSLFVGATSNCIDKKLINQKGTKAEIIKTIVYIISMLIGLVLCYIFGTIWFMWIYLKTNSVSISLGTALSICVLPFIVFDIIKIVMAAILVDKIKKHVKL